MEPFSYKCPKCGHTEFEKDEMRATGGAFAKIFDVQNKKFTLVTCTRCKFTEMYKMESSTFGNVVDFFTS